MIKSIAIKNLTVLFRVTLKNTQSHQFTWKEMCKLYMFIAVIKWKTENHRPKSLSSHWWLTKPSSATYAPAAMCTSCLEA